MELPPVLEDLILNKLSLGELYSRIDNDKMLQSYKFWLTKTYSDLILRKIVFDRELKDRKERKDKFPFAQAFIELLENEISTSELVDKDYNILSREILKNDKIYEYFKDITKKYYLYDIIPDYIDKKTFMENWIR